MYASWVPLHRMPYLLVDMLSAPVYIPGFLPPYSNSWLLMTFAGSYFPVLFDGPKGMFDSPLLGKFIAYQESWDLRA